MKLNALLLAAMGSMLVASCADDGTTIVEPEETNVIRFSAIANQTPSRADGDDNFGATTTASLKEFSVFAYTNNTLIMNDVTVTKGNDNSWNYSPKTYWPTSAVNFYAFAPTNWGDTEQVDPTGAIDYYDQYGDTDLLYAVKKGARQGDGPVMLNFRHALAQIIVKLRTDSASRLAIKVRHTMLSGIKTTGIFTFPDTTTSPITDSEQTVTGQWSKQSGENSYILFLAQTPDDIMVLDSVPQTANQISKGFLLPQSLGTSHVTPDGSIKGDLIAIDCIIYDLKTGQPVWPNDKTPANQVVDYQDGGHKVGRIYFSTATNKIKEWEQGVRYIYTITINNPEGIGMIDFASPTVDVYTEVEDMMTEDKI